MTPAERAELEEMLEMASEHGYVHVRCSVCRTVAQIEPDGEYPCPEKGCPGKVSSPLLDLGMI